MKEMIKAPKGTKDLLPSESYKWHYLEGLIRKVTGLFNIKEIRTPIFESTELFARGVGESTDIVNKEMYTFNDKGNRSITLKPEGTAGVVRSYIENGLHNEPGPMKAYYVSPIFRYERPQKGRLRQHHQFGVEYFGSTSPLADAEVIAVAVNFFKQLGINNVTVNINSIGNVHDREKYKKDLKLYFVDKLDGLCADCKKRFDANPLRLLDCKVDMEKEAVKNAPSILNSLSEESASHFEKTKKALTLRNIDFKVNDKIVRGLDYYTNTVFEIICNDITGPSKVICGGGRYNSLVQTLGGKETPAVGFGMGLERILLLLEEFDIKIPENNNVDVYVLNDGDYFKAVELVNNLRNNNINCDMNLMNRSFKAQLKYANKLNAKYVVFVGENLELKDMNTGEQIEITEKELLKRLKGE